VTPDSRRSGKRERKRGILIAVNKDKKKNLTDFWGGRRGEVGQNGEE